MATTTLNTRIQLKYDTYENWTTNNPVLLAGEVAVTTVQSAQAPVSQVPAILFKVGDGTNNFNALNWASAIAADVYPWAKASAKPTYQASEIEGLEDYISGQIEDTDTQYQIIASGTNGIQLQSRPKTGGAWTNVGSPITITYTLETGTTNGTVSFNGTEVAVKGLGSAAYTESSAYAPAGAGVPPTDTAQAGDVPTWDGQNVVWAPPSGDGGKNWVLLYNNTINISDYVQAAQDVLLQSCEGITEIHGIFATSEISGTINGEPYNSGVGIAIGDCWISYGRLFNTGANSRGLFSILNDLEYSYWYKASNNNLSMEYNSANQVGGNCKKPKKPDYDHLILKCLAANYAFKGNVELIIYGR